MQPDTTKWDASFVWSLTVFCTTNEWKHNPMMIAKTNATL